MLTYSWSGYENSTVSFYGGSSTSVRENRYLYTCLHYMHYLSAHHLITPSIRFSVVSIVPIVLKPMTYASVKDIGRCAYAPPHTCHGDNSLERNLHELFAHAEYSTQVKPYFHPCHSVISQSCTRNVLTCIGSYTVPVRCVAQSRFRHFY